MATILKTIDLRSDTITRPTQEMLAAMFAAEVGDDVYGDDPSVNALEEKVADLLGKEAALFVPSGTMANQIAINVHCRPGESVIAEERAHIHDMEAGAPAVLSGVQFRMTRAEQQMSDEAIESCFMGEELHHAPTTLLAVENTHNRGGGRPLAVDELSRITGKARSLGMNTHCDGARIWNAAVATGSSEAELAAGFDSVACCFSKGLGAPVGSALCGQRDFIARARKVRKRWGGGMRQAGYLAAAASYALDHHRARCADDHRRAQQFCEGLRALSDVVVEVDVPERITNIVFFRVDPLSDGAFQAHLEDHNLSILVKGDGWYRAVFHLHISDEDVAHVLDTISAFRS